MDARVFTAVYQKVPEGYVAWVEEVPNAMTQGATLEEAREMLAEALVLVLEENRNVALEYSADGALIREPLEITV